MKNDDLAAVIAELAKFGGDEYRDRSVKVCAEYGLSPAELDALWEPARKQHLQELGVTHLSTAFFGYESADAAKDFIATIVVESAHSDRVYEDDYLKAAAALMQFDSAAFERLGRNLKDKGVRRSRWEPLVKEKLRAERERLKALSSPRGGGGSAGPSSPALPGDIDLQWEPRTQVKAALDALMVANSPPFLFRRAKALVRLRVDRDSAELSLLDRDGLFAELNDAARFFHDTQFGKTFKFPPKTLISAILGAREFTFLAIDRIATAPFFTRDGELVATPGFHPGARVYLHLADGLIIPPVSLEPTTAEVEQARDRLLWVIRQFPFKTQADKANALALEIGLFVRDLIPGNVPMFGVKAPNRSGKGKLIKTLCAPAVGVLAAMPEIGPKEQDELRKRLTALVLQGTPVAFFDNINRVVEGSALATILTEPQWKDRMLGESRLVDLPVRSFWILAGKGLQFDRELLLRSIRIEIDPNHPHPERRVFKEPKELAEYALDHRGELIWACLTIVRNWLARGRPEVQTKHRLGGFEGFVRVMGGVLHASGIEGFLDGLEEYHDEEEVETDNLPPFIAAWWEAHKDKAVGAGTLIELPDADLLIPVRKGDTAHARAIRLGRLLGRDLDRVFEIQPDDDKPPIQVKLLRGKYERDAGKGKLKGFFLAQPSSAGRKPDFNTWDMWEDEKESGKQREFIPTPGADTWEQKPLDFKDESAPPHISHMSEAGNHTDDDENGEKNKFDSTAGSSPTKDVASAPVSANGIPIVMTGWMKAALRHLGFSDEAITWMKPTEGHALISTRLGELGLDERSLTPEQKLAAIKDHEPANEDQWEEF